MPAAYLIIMPASLLLGLSAGFIMHRGDFCFVCMLRNYFLFKQTFMLRMLTILLIVSMVFFEGARYFRLLPIYPFPLFGPPSPANVAGGMVFGFGMVLAGGCVMGTLYRAGSGSIVSFAALFGLLVGSGLYIFLHPWWMQLAGGNIISDAVTLPQMLSTDPALVVAAALLIAFAALLKWRDEPWVIHFRIDHHVQPMVAAICLAVIGLLSAIVVGMPMGVTTTYAKAAGVVAGLAIPGFTAKHVYLSANPLRYGYPLTGETLSGGAGPVFDAIAAVQLPLIVGIFGGGMLSAVLLREFKIHLGVPARQLLSGFFGGILMGLASRLTPGCNIWHVCGGLPIFALQSILFIAGLVPGAWLGTKVLVKWVIRP